MSNTWNQLSDRLVSMAIERRVPIIGQFELTSRCNLQCKMCYICNSPYDESSISKELSAKELIGLIEEARNAGMLYLLLTGGEVFIRSDFKEIYEAASMMGLNIVFYTNGTLITPEIAKWLGAIPPSWVEITLYGASGEAYERVCGDYKGFKNTLRGIDLLIEQGITLKIRTTVVKGNARDFDKIAEIAESRGLELGVVDYISPGRDGTRTNPEGERLTPEELTAYIKHVDEYFEEKLSIECIKANEKSQEDEKSKELQNPETSKIENPFFCEAGRCAFWVTWDGRMTPCVLMDMPAVNPFKNGFSKSWSELMKECLEVPSSMECNGCSLKKDCINCPARLKNETGLYNKPAKYLCEFARLKV